jgi:DNA-binding NtrC family response regulator
MKNLLLIEDDPIMGESLVQRFELEGFQVNWCRRLAEAAEALPAGFSAVISDVRLTDGLATHWFVDLPEAQRALPWFFLTGYGSVNDAIATVRAGAREYLTKPFDIERLVSMVQEASSPAALPPEEGVLGISPAMRRAEALVHKVAKQRVPVLLTGESGVGKEVAAQPSAASRCGRRHWRQRHEDLRAAGDQPQDAMGEDEEAADWQWVCSRGWCLS